MCKSSIFSFEKCDYLSKGKPHIELVVSRVHYSVWDLFKKHHYMSESANKSCKFFLFEWGIKPIAMVVLATNPSGTVKNSYRLSRTVVLPDYQGLGIGSKITDFIASIVDGRVFTKTVNPALGEYRNESPLWKTTSKHMKKLRGHNPDVGTHIWYSKTRPSYCHEYVGHKLLGYESILKSIPNMKL